MTKAKLTTMKLLSAMALASVSACATFEGSNSHAGASTHQSAQPQSARQHRRMMGGHSAEAFFNSNDMNGDGVVSREEFNAARAESYGAKDANGDQAVVEEEYVAEYEARLDAQLAQQREMQIRQAYVRFGVLDKDKDGVISMDEFNASGDRIFQRYDTDQNGVVSEADPAPERRR